MEEELEQREGRVTGRDLVGMPIQKSKPVEAEERTFLVKVETDDSLG